MLSQTVYKILNNAGCEKVSDHVVLGKVPHCVAEYLAKAFGVHCEWFAPAGTSYVTAEYEQHFH